jgi:PAS domain S-box-containing protein
LGGLFALAALFLGLMDLRMLARSTDSGPGPFVLLSLLVLAALFAAVVFSLTQQRTMRNRALAASRSELETLKLELEATRNDLEQRVERRTFEMSVANASLNREIAERIQAEAETRQVKRQMELILESAGEGIFGFDINGKVTFVNKAATLMLGWEPEELIGQSHHHIIHHTRADGTPYPTSECPIHRAYRDGKVHFGSDEVFWNQDGTSFPVEYISTPILEDGRLTGAVVVFRDLTTFR